MPQPSTATGFSPQVDLETLRRFAERIGGVKVSAVQVLAGGGSPRRYVRLQTPSASWGDSAIGVITSNADEARAFVAFTGHFRGLGIPVPRLYAQDLNLGVYLLEDLGDTALADRLRAWREQGEAGKTPIARAVAASLRSLAALQVRGPKGLDRAWCFDGAELNRAAFRADIDLFLTHYVPRFVLRPGPDAAVRADFDQLVERLDGLSRAHLCHRDFQARNILWPQDAPVFIDYQGARFGPLAYDVASFLYSPDSGLDEAQRAAGIAGYLESLKEEEVRLERAPFDRDLYAVVLVRRLQALGAYARIAVVEGKPEYLRKVEPALATLQELFSAGKLSLGLPALESWLRAALAPEGQTLQ